MSRLRTGNKKNCQLNGFWGKHIRAWGKKFSSGRRRCRDREIIIKELKMLTE